LALAVGVEFITALAVSYAALTIYDEPIRSAHGGWRSRLKSSSIASQETV
jgi:hypothetical protein